MNPVLETAIRAVAAYLIILILARFMGRKMISQMTFFDFVVGVTAGSVTANVALGAQATPLRAMAVLAVLALLTVLVDLVHLKSFLFTKAINSEPVVVIDRGKLKYANMQRVKLSVTELLTLLRQKNIFNLGDVDYAIFEIDGSSRCLGAVLFFHIFPHFPEELAHCGFNPGAGVAEEGHGRVLANLVQEGVCLIL